MMLVILLIFCAPTHLWSPDGTWKDLKRKTDVCAIAASTTHCVLPAVSKHMLAPPVWNSMWKPVEDTACEGAVDRVAIAQWTRMGSRISAWAIVESSFIHQRLYSWEPLRMMGMGWTASFEGWEHVLDLTGWSPVLYRMKNALDNGTLNCLKDQKNDWGCSFSVKCINDPPGIW